MASGLYHLSFGGNWRTSGCFSSAKGLVFDRLRAHVPIMAKNNTPVRTGQASRAVQSDGSGSVDAFLDKVRAVAKPVGTGPGRLILALDATMSRQPTWDLACRLQGEMFDAAGDAGSLEMQLVYFRGFNECRSSGFVQNSEALKDLMVQIDCRGGHTQIRKVLNHGLKENSRKPVSAVIYIGDALEEPIDDLCDKAAKLGMGGVPVFLFQEGSDPVARNGFKEIARLSRGAWFRFDQSSAGILAKLLASIAVYASGGLKALKNRATREDILLIEQMEGKSSS